MLNYHFMIKYLEKGFVRKLALLVSTAIHLSDMVIFLGTPCGKNEWYFALASIVSRHDDEFKTQ